MKKEINKLLQGSGVGRKKPGLLGSAVLAGMLVLTCLLAAKDAGAADAPAPLLFLGNKNIAPVVYLDGSAPAGVAVDIVHALAKYISQPIEIRAIDWPEAQALVAKGEADALIQINQTEERKKIYDFSDPLLESHFSVFTSINRIGISGLSSLRGLRVGVEAGGLPKQLVEKDPEITTVIIPNFIEGFKQLNAGTIDAIIVDYRVGSYVIAANNLRDIKVAGEPIMPSYSSLAVKKGNAKLLDEINNALKIIKADGTYQNILDSWSPKEVIFQTQEQIAKEIYYVIIFILLLLSLVTGIWILALRKELVRRKLAEKELRVERGLFVAGPTVVFKWKAEEGWPVEYVSPNVMDQFGYDPDDFISGKVSYSSIIHPDDLERVAKEVAAYSTKNPVSFEQAYRIARADKTYRWVSDFTIIIKGNDGTITHYLGYLLDITGRKEAEERLKELDKLKDDFLSVTTHELKTPLVPIKSQSQLLLAEDYGKINQKQREAIEMIYRNEEILDVLSSEVLDIAKIKSNKFKLLLENDSLNTIIADVVEDTEVLVRQKNITFSVLPLPEMSKVMIDGQKIKQVLSNLINNAIKFTPENGRIIFEAKKDDNNIVISVKDSGIGLGQNDIARLFTPFFQVESNAARKYRGTGLGLAICKGIIEAHGGKIRAESAGKDKGSTFIFSLPIK